MLHRIIPVAAASALWACSSAVSGSPPSDVPINTTPAVQVALADSVRSSFTHADIEFMAGMIHHHVQALTMADMVPSRSPSGRLKTLAARIINAQQDEIALMQRWLTDRDLPSPHPRSDDMNEPDDPVHMPGMLTADQLAEMEAATGDEFDRLFLVYMIQHHEGALTMVNDLFATQGAAREQTMFKLASDIGADQSSEIERMQLMLSDLLFGDGDA